MTTHISPKVGGCDIGFLVHDYALGRSGIVVDGAFTEETPGQHNTRALDWEWLVLYEDGELMGADTNDLQVIKDNHESR
ncbi:MAG TPA: hypothetical protein EYF95_04120 [Flavobacteriales bacterium]|jgi:hypothetical protein|nr:hypothetical protein [Flavobacteriales bacterium]